jgi:hypothetical protein
MIIFALSEPEISRSAYSIGIERLELKNNALGEEASQLVYKGNAYRLFS